MTVVVGYVPKPEGRAALERAVDEALLRGERLVVLNSSRGQALVDARFAGQDDWEAVHAMLRGRGVDAEVRQLVHDEEAADAVVGLAADVRAGLIVIGLRRRSPVGKLILGSTAQQILLDAPCPVLAVMAPSA